MNTVKIFDDQTSVFLSSSIVSELRRQISNEPALRQLLRVVPVEGDSVIKITHEEFVLTLSHITNEAYVAHLAASSKLSQFLGGFETLEFIHKRLPHLLNSFGRKHLADLADAADTAALIIDPTLLTDDHGHPIIFIYSDVNELNTFRDAIKSVKPGVVTTPFKDNLDIRLTHDAMSELYRLLSREGLPNTMLANLGGDGLGDRQSLIGLGYEVHFTKVRSIDGFVWQVTMEVDASLAPALAEVNTLDYLTVKLRELQDGPSNYSRVTAASIAALLYTGYQQLGNSVLFTYDPKDKTMNSENNNEATATIGERLGEAADTLKEKLKDGTAAAADTVADAAEAVHDRAETAGDALRDPSFWDSTKAYVKNNASMLLVQGAVFTTACVVGSYVGVTVANRYINRA